MKVKVNNSFISLVKVDKVLVSAFIVFMSLFFSYWSFISIFKVFGSAEQLVFFILVLSVILFSGDVMEFLNGSVLKLRVKYLVTLNLYGVVKVCMLSLISKFFSELSFNEEISLFKRNFLVYLAELSIFIERFTLYSKNSFFGGLFFGNALIIKGFVTQRCIFLVEYVSIFRLR